MLDCDSVSDIEKIHFLQESFNVLGIPEYTSIIKRANIEEPKNINFIEELIKRHLSFNPFVAIIFFDKNSTEEKHFNEIELHFNRLKELKQNGIIQFEEALVFSPKGEKFDRNLKRLNSLFTKIDINPKILYPDSVDNKQVINMLKTTHSNYFGKALKSLEQKKLVDLNKQREFARENLFNKVISALMAEAIQNFKHSAKLWKDVYSDVFEYIFLMKDGEFVEIMEIAAFAILKVSELILAIETRFGETTDSGFVKSVLSSFGEI
ncbi:hypothetical protein MHBO_000803 [Bonamia ostreae]|uniref:Uncharacterized protein n=1 Tax=Bonamia ostreae TaxID=126728 RepID=A0ABV2AGX9_9EUKA